MSASWSASHRQPRTRQRTPPDPYAAALAQVQAERRRREEDAVAREIDRDEAQIRDECATLPGFIRRAWSILEPEQKYVHNWHIDAMADHLDAVTRADITHLAINIPPGFMKSLMVSVFFPAWWWTKAPGKRFLTGSYEQGLAVRDAEKMRTLVQSPWYATLWGEKTRLTKAGAQSMLNVTRGGREARAYHSLTGARGDVVLIDDPHSTKTAESDADRNKVTTMFRESISDRTNNPDTSAIIVIMQRLHTKDVCGIIDEMDVGYERLILPMEYDPARLRVRGENFIDPRKTRGELLTNRSSPERVAKLKKTKGPYAWSGQYQQAPVPREGGMFKRAWFDGKILDSAPPGTVWVRHWDLAATKLNATDTKGARTAGVKMGRTLDGRYIVGHLVTVAEEGEQVRATVLATAQVDGKSVEVSLPQDPGQAGKVQKKAYIKDLAGWVVHIRPETGDKEVRAEPFSSQCEGGNVYLLAGSWNEEYLDEVCLFPGGARKDIVDASSGGFGRLLGEDDTPNEEIAAPLVFEIDTADEYEEGYD